MSSFVVHGPCFAAYRANTVRRSAVSCSVRFGILNNGLWIQIPFKLGADRMVVVGTGVVEFVIEPAFTGYAEGLDCREERINLTGCRECLIGRPAGAEAR